VEVRVDAYPNRVFSGRVVEIANRAEYTPGNVQTREERTKLVFAVKIALENPGWLLKPGLPADALLRVQP
jgi:HlyD family secretion protein